MAGGHLPKLLPGEPAEVSDSWCAVECLCCYKLLVHK